MRTSTEINKTDVLFLHADNQSIARGDFTAPEIRQGLLLHIMYCGRVLLPVDFLLTNVAFDPLFRFKNQVSDRSDIFRLISTDNIVPIIYSSKYENIMDYARHSLERGIVINCPKSQWLERAALLNQLSHTALAGENTRDTYKGILLELLRKPSVRREYFSSASTGGNQFVEEFTDQVALFDRPYRSDVYTLIEKSQGRSAYTAAKRIADAAYYVSLAESLATNPAVPDPTAKAVIAHYHGAGTDVPFLYSPGRERIIGAPLPDLSYVSLATVVEELQDNPRRKEWLRVNQKKLQEGHLDLHDQEVWNALNDWSDLLRKHLSSSPAQRQRLAESEHQMKLRTQVVKLGSRLLFVVGVVSSVAEVAQAGFPVLGLSFVSATLVAELALDHLDRKIKEQRQQTYGAGGSVIPVTSTFTPRPERLSR